MKARDIHIPEPCHEDWDRMTPGERGRFCAACRQTVHDLSSMTERDAARLLASDGDICVSYESGAGGEVRFAAEPLVPLSRLRRGLPIAAAASLSLALAACAPHGDGPSLRVKEEHPTFLEVTPAIPDAEPCESTPSPAAQPEVAPTAPQPDVRPQPRVKGRMKPPPRKMGKRMPSHRTAGKPMPVDIEGL